MSEPSSRASRAGGAILAIAITAGAFFGARMGQPSIGVLIGIAFGTVVSLGLWLYDRRK